MVSTQDLSISKKQICIGFEPATPQYKLLCITTLLPSTVQNSGLPHMISGLQKQDFSPSKLTALRLTLTWWTWTSSHHTTRSRSPYPRQCESQSPACKGTNDASTLCPAVPSYAKSLVLRSLVCSLSSAGELGRAGHSSLWPGLPSLRHILAPDPSPSV